MTSLLAVVAATMAAAAPSPAVDHTSVAKVGSPETKSHRFAGHRWRDCGERVDNSATGYDISAIRKAASGTCREAITVFVALSKQVERVEARGQDCFPGYCTADNPRPTRAAGYRCTAKEYGDVSIDRFITCRKGSKYVGASVADDE